MDIEVLLRASLPEFHSCRLERCQAEAVKGAILARHEGNFRASAEAPLSLGELLDLLADSGGRDERSREHAIARYLSGDEGWRDALQQLGGTFAAGAAGLKENKAD